MIIPNNGFNDAFLYFRVKEWTIIVNDLVASLHIEAQLNKATVNSFLLLPPFCISSVHLDEMDSGHNGQKRGYFTRHSL